MSMLNQKGILGEGGGVEESLGEEPMEGWIYYWSWVFNAFWKNCDVVTLIYPQGDLTTFGYRLTMKVIWL
jgi:hypothetical protein